MCLRIERPPLMGVDEFIKSSTKIAEEDISTYKIVLCKKLPWYSGLFSRIRNRHIKSYYQSYSYTLGEKTDQTPLGIRYYCFGDYLACTEDITTKDIRTIEVYEGYHSYSVNNTHIHVDEIRDLIILNKGRSTTYDHYFIPITDREDGYTLAIMQCIIPKGTKYSTNDKCEYVSETILPVRITPATVNKLKHLRKTGFHITVF